MRRPPLLKLGMAMTPVDLCLAQSVLLVDLPHSAVSSREGKEAVEREK